MVVCNHGRHRRPDGFRTTGRRCGKRDPEFGKSPPRGRPICPSPCVGVCDGRGTSENPLTRRREDRESYPSPFALRAFPLRLFAPSREHSESETLRSCFQESRSLHGREDQTKMAAEPLGNQPGRRSCRPALSFIPHGPRIYRGTAWGQGRSRKCRKTNCAEVPSIGTFRLST